MSTANFKSNIVPHVSTHLNPRNRALYKLIPRSFSQKIHPLLWNQMVHYRVHKNPQPALSWNTPIQSVTCHLTSCRYILILYSVLRLCLPSGFFSSVHPTKPVYAFIIRPCVLHDPPISSLWKSSLSSSLATLSLLSSHALSNLFSNILTLCSRRKVKDEVSYSCKTTGNIRVLYI